MKERSEMPLLNDLRNILEQTYKLSTERPHLHKLLTEHREKLLQHLATLEKHEADLANHAKTIREHTQAIESERLYCTQITNIQREKIPEYRKDIAAYLAACSCSLYRDAERYAPESLYDPCLSEHEAVTVKEEHLAKQNQARLQGQPEEHADTSTENSPLSWNLYKNL